MELDELTAQSPEDNTSASSLAEQIAGVLDTVYGGDEE